MVSRRSFIKSIGLLGVTPYLGYPGISWANDKRIIVVGGGAAGLIVAKYLKQLIPALDITLIEKNKTYIPAFGNNRVIGAGGEIKQNAFTYDALSKLGINIVFDTVLDVDFDKQQIKMKTGGSKKYDRLVMATGISIDKTAITGAGLENQHYWSAGSDIHSFVNKLQSMKQGGNVLVSVPQGAFSGPWAPYERVSQIASYCVVKNKSAKIILLNGDKQPESFSLIQSAWKKLYPGMIDVHFDTPVTAIDNHIILTAGGKYNADLSNLIPSNKANALLDKTGLVDATGWCPVEAGSFKSRLQKNVHVIGDAISSDLGLSKTAQSANAQAKLCAISIANEISGKSALQGLPPIIDSEYCTLNKNFAISRTVTYRVNKQGVISKSSYGISTADTSEKHQIREAQYALSWYNNITAEMFG